MCRPKIVTLKLTMEEYKAQQIQMIITFVDLKKGL